MHTHLLILPCPIKHQLDPLNFLSLPHNHIPGMPSLLLLRNLDFLETPNLVARPTITIILNIALNHLALRRLRQPVLAQELLILVRLVEVRELDPAATALEVAEEVVRVRAPLVVEGAQLGGAIDAAGEGLPEVDVGDGGVLFVEVLLQVLRHGGEADRYAGEPVDAL